MSKIQILPPELVNQIAAGEVVERPSSVVKELVENAIDAGATRIEVQATDGGRNIRVADNGCGMDADDLQVAFKNHATSKVRALTDLFQIETLGFRGEALASIAAIARVTCTSRTADAEAGLKATVQPSGDVTLQETGCAVGTIFEVQELFYNVPARLKFLRRPQTELSHIQEMLQMLALSHPEIAFQLKLENTVALKTSGQGDLAKAIGEVFSLGDSDTLVPFDMLDEEFGYRVWGLTSTPNVTRGSRKWMMTFVNARGVRCPIIGKAIEGAYDSLMTPGKFPVTVLFLEIPPEEVDVNVHPTKKEVKYQRANSLYSFVRSAISRALTNVEPMTTRQPLLDAAPTPHNLMVDRSAPRPSTGGKTGGSYQPLYPATREGNGSGYHPQSERRSQPEAPRPVDTRAAMELYAPAEESSNAAGFEPWLPQLPDYKIIGQLSNTYILVENPEGLLVVDQHIASERTLFELFSEQAERTEPVSQQLLIPLKVPVTPVLSAILEESSEALTALGFVYEVDDKQARFTSIPPLYNERTFKTSFERLIAHCEETGEVKLSVDDAIATMACHSAVRAGDVLNADRMHQIIAQWLRCQRPWTCPHGRPVSHLMPHREIMNFFERPSLPARR